MANPMAYRSPRPNFSGFSSFASGVAANAFQNLAASATAVFQPNTSFFRVSNAQDLGTHTLVSTSNAIQSSRTFDDEIRRLTEQGVYPNATTTEPLFPNAREYRNTKFGTFGVLGDNRQGECNYLWLPTLTPSDLDDCLKAFYDLTTIGLRPGVSSLFDWRDRKLILKNACSQKAEIDVWICWPKEDVPFSETPGYDENYFYTSNFSVPPVFYYPYGTSLMPVAGSNVDTNSSADFKSVEARRWNDWSSSPNENPWFRFFYDVQYHGNYKLVPGDEITFDWGTPNSQRIQPFTQLLLNAGELKDPYPFYNRFALMKRCGPQILIRARGRLTHDETKAGEPSSVNFGMFNLDFALITTQKWRPLHTYFNFTDEFRAQNPNGNDPQDVNQATSANSQSWHFVIPTESSSNA